MAAIPKTTVEDDFVEGLTCAICGRPELYVQHLPTYPDFVTCRHCGAAFVVEDTGERIMYGKIPDGYPDTTEFALRQWVWLEAVERRADEERPRPSAAPPAATRTAQEAALPPAPVTEPEPQMEVEAEEEPEAAEELPEPQTDWLAARLQPEGMPAGVLRPTEVEPGRAPAQDVPLASEARAAEPPAQDVPLASEARAAEPPPPARTRDETPPAAPAPPGLAEVAREIPRWSIAPPPAAAAAIAAPAALGAEGEPAATHRYRVVIRGDRLRMPITACAHCQRSPAPARIAVAGSLPRRGDPGRRRPATFQVPLCRDCSQRAGARSPERRAASLMAHLTGALVGLVLIVAVLAVNVIPIASSLPVGLAVLGAAWLLGYGVTAALLLERARRLPPPVDATYVRTTLLVVPDPAAPQTAFEFRNRETAVTFSQANGTASLGEPVAIPEAPPPSS